MAHRFWAPAVRGGVLALLAAGLFGISTSLAQFFGRGLGAFTTAVLLYLGAAWVGNLLRQPVTGLSLRFYLLAQRAFGAARTGSMFAFAPFIGAVLAFALGERSASALMGLGGLLMLLGVVLHLTETHDHAHHLNRH